MIYRVPDYYKSFKCMAGECPATCCVGWKIVIDGKSLKRYSSRKGIFGNRLKNSVDWKEGVFRQHQGRCAFLNDENLCDMYLEAGPEEMCVTCRKYPRHVEIFNNEREISLSLSCPAAAELILGRKDPVKFLKAEDKRRDREDEDFDYFLYSGLQDARKVLIEMMQDRSENVFLRMAMVLALTYDVQNRINAGRVFEIGEVPERYQKPGAKERLKCRILAEAQYEHRKEAFPLMNFLDEWEILDGAWQRDVRQWKACLLSKERVETAEIPETEYEQMMVYFLYTYFCGAVYDGDALAKTKMAAVSTLIWEEIVYAEKILQGRCSYEDRKRLAWRLSRELEHSDPNLNKMEELMNLRAEAEFYRMMKMLAFRARMERSS